MHELSLTMSLVELAVEHARRAQATAIRSITVEIGALSGVAAEAIAFAFESCSRGTAAEGAQLEILRVSGLGRCLACRQEMPLAPADRLCPLCGSLALEIVQGEEMRVTEMEID